MQRGQRSVKQHEMRRKAINCVCKSAATRAENICSHKNGDNGRKLVIPSRIAGDAVIPSDSHSSFPLTVQLAAAFATGNTVVIVAGRVCSRPVPCEIGLFNSLLAPVHFVHVQKISTSPSLNGEKKEKGI